MTTLRFFTVTELKQKATQIVSEIERTGNAAVVTKNGKPVIVIRPVSEDEFCLSSKPRKKKQLRGGS